LVGITVGISFATLILSINAIMFVVLLFMRILLPQQLYWKNIKHTFTQYHWNWLLFKWGKIKVVYEGESSSLRKGEPALMISNHQDDLDFGMFVIVYQEQGIRSAETKWISKKSVSFIPFFGWVHWLTGDLFLNRSWESDGPSIKTWLSKFKERNFKRIVIFPEGTRVRNKKKFEDSNTFASQNNLPLMKNVLYPRTKGFSLIAKYFRDNPGCVDYVYDFTFGYNGGGVGFWKFFQGPIYTDIHVFVRRHRISDIGVEGDDFADWCIKRFQIKEKLLDYFNQHGKFPSVDEAIKIERQIEKGKGKITGSK